MLRFLSRRKVRNNYVDNSRGGGGPGGSAVGVAGGGAATAGGSQIKPQRIVVNKNKIDCRVILLDNTDLSIELSVSTRPPHRITLGPISIFGLNCCRWQ